MNQLETLYKIRMNFFPQMVCFLITNELCKAMNIKGVYAANKFIFLKCFISSRFQNFQ